MVRSFDVPSTCAPEPVVPNTLLKTWISVDCPAVQDYVSMLVAVLQLRPAKVIYYLSNAIDERAKYKDGERGCRYFRWPTHGNPHQFATFPVAQCMRTLGVEFELLDLANASSPFRRATAGFAGSGVFFRRTNRIAKPVELSMLTDLVRAYALHHAEGGLYLDGDVFVLRRSFARWRRCPVALAYNAFRLPDDATPDDATPDDARPVTTTAAAAATRPTAALVAASASVEVNGWRRRWNVTWAAGGDLNTAAAFMARGTPFGAAWWAQAAKFDGTRFADAQQLCCGMPSRCVRAPHTRVQKIVEVHSFGRATSCVSRAWFCLCAARGGPVGRARHWPISRPTTGPPLLIAQIRAPPSRKCRGDAERATDGLPAVPARPRRQVRPRRGRHIRAVAGAGGRAAGQRRGARRAAPPDQSQAAQQLHAPGWQTYEQTYGTRWRIDIGIVWGQTQRHRCRLNGSPYVGQDAPVMCAVVCCHPTPHAGSRSGTHNQMLPVLREAVVLALAAAGGAAALRPVEADCARLALRMLNFEWGDPAEAVDLDDVHGDQRRGGGTAR